jgi:hypothetical protein
MKMYKPKSEIYSTSETDGPRVSHFRRMLQRLRSTVKTEVGSSGMHVSIYHNTQFHLS